MKKIAIGTICALPLITAAILVLAAREAPPEFEVTAIGIEPRQVTCGETATIRAEVRNSGGSEGTYDAVLSVDRTEADRKDCALAPGETVIMTFSLVMDEPGYHEIAVGNRSTALSVLEPPPPAFNVSQLEIDPQWVDAGEETTVTARIVNTGGTKGSYIAKLTIDGTTEQTAEVTLSPGTHLTVTFLVTVDVPGNYMIGVGELTGELAVFQPVEPIVIKIKPYEPSAQSRCDTPGG